jgi:hypothetical protein
VFVWVTWISIGMLLAIAAILTLAPVAYVALERAQMLKVAAVLLLVVVGGVFAITADAWSDLPRVVTEASVPVAELGFAVLLGALAFAGGGGEQNLVLVWSFLLFGTLATLTIASQGQRLFGG